MSDRFFDSVLRSRKNPWNRVLGSEGPEIVWGAICPPPPEDKFSPVHSYGGAKYRIITVEPCYLGGTEPIMHEDDTRQWLIELLIERSELQRLIENEDFIFGSTVTTIEVESNNIISRVAA